MFSNIFINLVITFLCNFLGSVFLLSSIDPLMDNDWYDINWYRHPISTGNAASSTSTTKHKIVDDQGTTVVMMTNNKEKYSCFVPSVKKQNEKGTEDQDGTPSPKDLLEQLRLGSSCSYRLESYWTYELCHSRYLKQYHGDKDTNKEEGKKLFYLGHYKDPPTDVGDLQSTIKPTKPKTVKLENVELPYYEVIMTGGTVCELTGEPRSVSLRYVCEPDGRGEIYQLKEISTCQYQVIVLTALLCQHSHYRPLQPVINKITCQPIAGAPVYPKKYTEYFPEDLRDSRKRTIVTKKVTAPPPKRVPTDIGAVTDKQTILSFFSGLHCIHGGRGWWKHEFCYGRYINQYHQDPLGRTTLSLGIWDEQVHKDWVARTDTPKSTTERMLVLYYGDGDICHETNKNRQTIVKLKCQSNSKQPHAITLYLLEPQLCEYELIVESKLFCGILDQADKYDLLYKPEI